MQSLKPVGLPPDSRRSSAMKCIISMGVENAECQAGEMQSCARRTPRMRGDLARHLGGGRTPPWPGLAPWLSLISIILICGLAAISANLSGANVPSVLRQPK